MSESWDGYPKEDWYYNEYRLRRKGDGVIIKAEWLASEKEWNIDYPECLPEEICLLCDYIGPARIFP